AAIASLRASFINEPSTTDTHPLSLHDALPILGGDVHFTTDQRFDAASHRLSVKLHRPMKDAVIRQGDRPHAQLFRLLYQPGRRCATVQQAIIRMNVEVDKLGWHGDTSHRPALSQTVIISRPGSKYR